MKITPHATFTLIPPQSRNTTLIAELLQVWEDSVRTTHSFLSESEIEAIKQYVPQALENIPILVVAQSENGNAIGFMGIANTTLEMLFIASEMRGKGIGKQLLQYGIDHYSVDKLAVNEQNPDARGFYEHMGFAVYKRTELDEQGNPYPLFYMQRVISKEQVQNNDKHHPNR